MVCCSLEAWDNVWRRNQFFVRELLALRSRMRLLFVEPPVDVLWSALRTRRVAGSGIRDVPGYDRLAALTPRKWLPRVVSPGVDERLGRVVQSHASRLGLTRPVLWVNDSGYAGLAERCGWPAVYDVTDDWTLAERSDRETRRQADNDRRMLAVAAEVVVCSPALAATRGAARPVRLIPNGVDTEHFRMMQPRPADLPPARTILYSGTAAPDRLDIGLCVELGTSLPDDAKLVFVGPNACSHDVTERLVKAGVIFLGARPYADMPAYMQHAEVIVVPHVVSAFTESLDPIKAREILAVGRPAVSTPVAGFRGIGGPVETVNRSEFTATVLRALAGSPGPGPGPAAVLGTSQSWAARSVEFLAALEAAAATRAG